MLTPKQAEILGFINTHRAAEQYNPTGKDACRHFGWSSENSWVCNIKALERKGAIAKRSSGRYVVLPPFERVGVVD
ncbi:MAG: repressor LexA [Pseudomonadota bacterium]